MIGSYNSQPKFYFSNKTLKKNEKIIKKFYYYLTILILQTLFLKETL